MRVAVVGLFRSGSSFWAKVLHRLGVNMGDRFWETDDPDHPDNHYEAWHLADSLRTLWNEPSLRHPSPRWKRVESLRSWIDGRPHTHCGAKHPLMSLSVDEIREAWGNDTAFVLCDRPLQDSINSVWRWNPPWEDRYKESIQYRLWDALQVSFRDSQPAIRLNFEWIGDQVATDLAIDKIVEALNLSPTQDQLNIARASFVPPLRNRQL